MTLVLLLILQGRTPGGHGLLEALPRIYQVTPDIPDRRRATRQTEVRPQPADSLKESQLAARSGPSRPRRTSPTSRIKTASLQAAVLDAGPIESARCPDSRKAGRRSGRRHQSELAEQLGLIEVEMFRGQFVATNLVSRHPAEVDLPFRGRDVPCRRAH